MSIESYDEDSLFRALVFESHKQFSEGREFTVDDQRPSRLVSVSTLQKRAQMNEIVRKVHRMSIQKNVEVVNVDKEPVRKMLHKRLNMKKVCA